MRLGIFDLGTAQLIPLLLSVLLVCTNSGPNVMAYDHPVSEGEKGKSIQRYLQEMNRRVGFTGAVLAAESRKVVAAVAVGTDGRKRPHPLTTDTLFEIASCTKTFTAIAVLKLQEQGKLELDDSIAKHLPSIPEDCQEITVRHLLQHTSGIPGSNTVGAGEKLEAVLPTFLAGGPKHEAGAHWEYWNQGYSLLSAIIANSSGKSYTDYCRSEIFEVCGMKETRFTGDKSGRKTKVAVGRSEVGKPRSALQHPYGEYGFQYRGMGGIVTNIEDLWLWQKSLSNGKLLSKESIAEMYDGGQFGYGLGVRVEKVAGEMTSVYHTGRVRGFLASIRWSPDSGDCLIVLGNSDSGGPFNKVTSGCERLLGGEKLSAVLPKRLSSELIASLIGKYEDNTGRLMTISSNKEELSMSIDWGGPVSNGTLAVATSGQMQFQMPKARGKMEANPITLEIIDGKVIRVIMGGQKTDLVFERSN
jgi:CubicO group peptidase (beta-lactamase class C family)